MAHCDAGSGSHPLHQWRINSSLNAVDLVNKLDAEARDDRSAMQAPLVQAQWPTPNR